MGDFTSNEIVDMILILGECRGVYVDAATLYTQRFPGRRHPCNVTIRNLTTRAGQMTRQRRHHEYDEKNVRVLTILASVHLDPHISSRRLEVSTEISKSTILRILKARKYHAYHITLTQALLPADFDRRFEFCRWALQQIDRDPNFFRFVMFSDEATFKNTSELNRHNCHYWADTNPHWHRANDNQHRWSLNV